MVYIRMVGFDVFIIAQTTRTPRQDYRRRFSTSHLATANAYTTPRMECQFPGIPCELFHKLIVDDTLAVQFTYPRSM